MAAMHQDTSEDHDVVNEKLKEIFGVKFVATYLEALISILVLIVKGRMSKLNFTL